MCVFSSPSFDHHELVTFAEHQDSGLRAIIAVHNSNLGPGVGGCRMFPYASDVDALEDVLRLSRGMTYKSALAGLPMGGGKAVIIGDHRKQKTPALLEAMGDFIDAQGGKYVTAEDSGTSVADMKVIGQRTSYVSGVDDKQSFGGDPSPFTAQGIFYGIKAALQHKVASDELKDVRVALQGAGAVGRYLAKLLLAEGAQVFVADINEENLKQVVAMGAQQIGVDEVLSYDADVLAPCAMGAILNDDTIPHLKAKVIAGGANNQLAESRHGNDLRELGILYAPDFVINAGGIIEIHHQRAGSAEKSSDHVARIGTTLSEIFAACEQQGKSTLAVAEQLAEEKFRSPALLYGAAYSASNNA